VGVRLRDENPPLRTSAMLSKKKRTYKRKKTEKICTEEDKKTYKKTTKKDRV